MRSSVTPANIQAAHQQLTGLVEGRDVPPVPCGECGTPHFKGGVVTFLEAPTTDATNIHLWRIVVSPSDGSPAWKRSVIHLLGEEEVRRIIRHHLGSANPAAAR